MGDDAEDQRVLDHMVVATETLRREGFAGVQAATLREDWPEPRAHAEEAIRSFVDTESAAGRDVLVVPARLFGFGPYADVLADRSYRAGDGLLPHPAIAGWTFAAIIMFGSVYTGWHYALDGYLSFIVVTAIWFGVSYFVGPDRKFGIKQEKKAPAEQAPSA